MRKVESERVCRNEGATTDAQVEKNLGSRGSGFGFTGLVPSSRSGRSSLFTTPSISCAAVASASAAEGTGTRGHLAAVGALSIRGAHRPPCSGEWVPIPRAFREHMRAVGCGGMSRLPLMWASVVRSQNRHARAVLSWV